VAVSFRREIIDPGKLDPPALRALGDDLYSVQQEIFDGVDREVFQRYVVDADAAENKILVLRDGAGAPLGYAALHFYELEIDGQPATVLRTELGYTRALRGRNPAGRFGVSTVVGYVARNPRRLMYFLGCPVHPTTYLAAARWSPKYWPRYDQPTPAKETALIHELAERFGLEVVGDDPLVRRVGWITRQTESERAYWASNRRPEVRFYLDRNPGYLDGHGLLLFAPLDMRNLRQSLGRWFQGRVSRHTFKIRASLDRVTGGSDVELDQAVDGFAAAPLLSDLPREALAALAQAARAQSWPAGSWVFRQGDISDAMYVVLDGSAYVLIDDGGEERVVEQLDRGDVFGELGLVTAAPRSAGIRSMRNLRVLRVGGAALETAIGRSQALADALWRRIAQIRLEAIASDVPMLAEMSRDQRAAWFDDGRPWTDGDPTDGFVWLYEGRGAMADPESWVSAPSLLSAGAAFEPAAGALAYWLPAISGPPAK